MVDYIKIKLLDADIDRLKEKFDFSTRYTPNTAETDETYEYKTHFCTLTIYPSGNVYFKGSIHKYWNSLHGVYKVKGFGKNRLFNKVNTLKEGFNANQFDYSNIISLRRHLCCLLECHPDNMLIQGIEFGVNLFTDFAPRTFVKGLLYHKAKPFDFKHYKNYAQCKHWQYLVKIYNKSYQYRLSSNILRVEVKITKSLIANNIGIETFNDITPQTLENALEYVKTAFIDSVYFDYTIRENELSNLNQTKVKDYKNQLYWTEDLDKKQRHKQKENLNKLILHYSDNLKGKILTDIDKKRGLFNQYHINLLEQKRGLNYPLNIELSSTLFCEMVKNKFLSNKKAITA
jgi:hypothetical protein